MSRRKQKQRIITLLSNNSWADIHSALLSEKDEYRSLIHHLFTSLCSTNEKCKWHGVSSFGVVVPEIANISFEDARVIMRRFLWSLNDESGGIGWGAPEAMAEVMVFDSNLFDEYSHMLISYMREDGPEVHQDGNYLELPALQQGLLWGVGRLLHAKRDEMLEKGVEEDIYHYLKSPDMTVRGMAAWCLSQCKQKNVINQLDQLAESSFSFTLYHDYTLKRVTLGEMARHAKKQITERK